MKHLIIMRNLFFITVLFITSSAFAQISKVETTKAEEIGKIAPMGQFIIDCQKRGDTYTIMYKDWKFQHLDEYKQFSFKDEDDAFENLYQMIMDGFDNMPKEDIMLELPDGYLWLKFHKVMWVKQVSFGHSVDKSGSVIGYSRDLTKNNVQTLFGKK
jgi:hypothetical protein